MSKIIHILIFICCFNLYYLLIIYFISCTLMFSWPYISIPYLWPLLVVLLFVFSTTYLCVNKADHQTCRPFGGLWHIFLQDIHVLALHGPNGWKIIIDQIIAKNWKGFWHGQVPIIQITLGHCFFSWKILLLMNFIKSKCYIQHTYAIFLFIY